MIDDDVRYCRWLRDYLTPHDLCLLDMQGPLDAREMKAALPGTIILDVRLNGTNGFEVLRQIRAFSSVPVIMVTAFPSEDIRVRGLECGADDFLAKTATPRELLARLRALMRRSQMTFSQDAGQDLVVGALRINFRGRSVFLEGRPIELTQLEFNLLASLARSWGEVRTREQLCRALASDRLTPHGNAINVHISILRRKLGEDAGRPSYIHTIRGIGYKLAVPEKS